MQTQSHQSHQSLQSQILPPDKILQNLLTTPIDDCTCCNQLPQQSSNRNKEYHNMQNIEAAIHSLQQTLDAMNHQVVEVENLLSQRDVLYHQLDHLRADREGIQEEIQSRVAVHHTVKVKASRGLKEMNERLRRRIREVKDYIEKMDQQNIKIQESMSVTQNVFPSFPSRNIHTYTEYRGPSSPTWMQRITPTHQTYNKFNRDYFDDFRKRLQMKQDQAWQKVRRQQEEIETRNARSLMNFNKIGMRTGFLSPKYRAY